MRLTSLNIPAVAVGVLTLFARPAIAAPDSTAGPLDTAALSSFLETHCVKCHGEDKQKGDIRLDQLDFQIKEHSAVTEWQDILDVLNTNEMPPEDETQPPTEELTFFIGAITDNITSAHKRLAATGGKISMRHLTKREYLGSMEDLFGIELPRTLLPDDVSGEFDTIGADQFFSLKQYENFYKAGKEVIGKNLLAIASPLPKPTTLRHDPEIVPAEAAKAAYEKMIKVKALIEAGAPFSEIVKVDPKVADEGQAKLFIARYDKRSVKPIANYEKTKGKKGVSGSFRYTVESRPRSSYELKIVALEALEGDVEVSVNGKSVGAVNFEPGQSKTSTELTFSTSIFDSEITIEVEGRKNEVYDSVALSGPFEDKQNKPTFFEKVVSREALNSDASDDEIAAMLKRFTERAFRYQGVSDEYIAELVKVYRLEIAAGKDAAASLVEPLTAVVTAPAFLYLKEKNDGTRRILSQQEFAIRMAYFLWGTPPDRELYDLAASNGLYDDDAVRSQFERMLGSNKADVFLTDFINQWADINRFDEIDLPVKLIRNGFETSARQEISEFFKVLVRENHSLNHLIDSDFVVVDEKLAQYYGLKTDLAEGFEKVTLPESSPRGGMLTQAAFLITGSSGARTSPTIRGTLIREKFLNDAPPPPPPNVPAVENPKGQKLTVKQLVDRHQNVAQCASCHDKIDPIGYGLENFDYLGNWRTEEVLGGDDSDKKTKKKKGAKAKPALEKVAVDASGYLKDQPFEDFEGLQQVLLKNRDRLALSLYESLLSYGIGRDIEFVDDAEIQKKLSDLKSQDYPLKEMIFTVMTSRTFATK
ncbi:MAG: DUF1588 domain-containing protein [Verrucomicrobiales bacterium]|nr:DUF1588 domain-containing protein [Verrucomicrobiales bacterium]